MKSIILASSLLFILLFTIPASADTLWHSSITVGAEFHWNAEKAELRDLNNEEKYDFGIGGSNIKGGDIQAIVQYEPSEFDFFFDNVLIDQVTIEGDMLQRIVSLNESENDVYYTDDDYIDRLEFHLLMLPTHIDEGSFFDFFFDHTDFIENMTNTKVIDTSIVDNLATYNGLYNGTHSVTYQWDTETGLLFLKEVGSESDHYLRVVQGEGTGFGLNIDAPFYTLFAGMIFSLIVIRRNHRNR